MNNPLLQKFTTHYKHVLARAHHIAKTQGTETVRPIHAIWALADEPGSLATEILRKAGLKAPDTVASDEGSSDTDFAYPLHDAMKSVIKKSVIAASRFHHKYIGTEHLLLSLLEHDDHEVTEALTRQQIDQGLLKKHIGLVLKSTSRFPDLTLALAQGMQEDDEEEEVMRNSPKTKTPALEFFARELTAAATQARIDPVIGRAREINRVIQILARKTKNNPVLLGDPGVGKTAIVEGLAKRIHEGNIPDLLLRKRIYSIDLALLVAGTMYRGEFESRIKQVIDEAKANPDIILFIDELHTIIGAGSASGSLDAANILKPALARGEIRCIGATTYEEYKRHIETDPALERRFQAIQVEEPSIEETIGILKGIKGGYEAHHHVEVTDDALRAAVSLSAHYLCEKRLPDKAIDLVDEASAMKRIARGGEPHLRELRTLEEKLARLIQKKEEAVRKEDFPLALSLKEEERTLRTAREELETRGAQGVTDHAPATTVTREDIVHVLSDMTGIPLGSIQEEERTHLTHLEEQLRARIVGQDDAIKEIAGFIRRSRAGLAGSTRPMGSFILLGPSGVGKTETAKALAEVVFRDPHALIRFDMSEYGESFNISKLIGAPAGYVGYREGGKLTEMVRRKPYAVILFDEIEKAHPDVFNLFLSILDEGHVTDATGRRIDFRNTIILMTSNIGLPAFNEHAALGFTQTPEGGESEGTPKGHPAVKYRPARTSKTMEVVEPREGTPGDARYAYIQETALKELRERFRPEFLNRVDRLLVFRPLDRTALRTIAGLQLARMKETLSAQGHGFTWDDAALDQLTALSVSPGEGARRIGRVLREHVEDAATEKILNEEIPAGASLVLTIQGGSLTLNVRPLRRAPSSPAHTRRTRTSHTPRTHATL